MTTLAEIEAAIEKLPAPQVDDLAHWIEMLRTRRVDAPSIESWLQGARGNATHGVTTDAILNATRGES